MDTTTLSSRCPRYHTLSLRGLAGRPQEQKTLSEPAGPDHLLHTRLEDIHRCRLLSRRPDALCHSRGAWRFCRGMGMVAGMGRSYEGLEIYTDCDAGRHSRRFHFSNCLQVLGNERTLLGAVPVQ